MPGAGAIRKLGIITAMDEEFGRLDRSLSHHGQWSFGPRTFYQTTLEGIELVLVRSRIGKVAAATTAAVLLDRFSVDGVIFTGVAGGVGTDIHVGDIIVADKLVQHDIDLQGVLGCHRFDIPLLGVSSMLSDKNLMRCAVNAADTIIAPETAYRKAVEKLCHRDPRVHVTTIASGDRFICDRSEAASLRDAIPGLGGVEMEGAAVAQVCTEMNVPFTVIRTVSDNADDTAHVDFTTFVSEAAAVASELLVRSIVRQLSALSS